MSDRHELIRPALPEDAEGVWPLVQDFATSFTLERTAFDTTWHEAVAAAGTLVLVAETDGIIGYLLGNSRRRSGVGRRLMDHAADWARSIDAAYVALASRRAGAFYLALGYEDSAVFYKRTLR